MTESLLQQLKKYNNTMLPFHMPGHKRNLSLSGKGGYLEALSADCDITEVAGFDNLAEPEELLLSVKKRAAALWHSEDAYLSVNGSTCGILAGIYATVSYGGNVIAARNCHKSVYNGLRLLNAKVSYLLPERDTSTGACGSVTPEAVETALKRCPGAQLVIITSPTYEGVLSDVEGICRTAHAHGVPVLVDSAHGAHLGFGAFPKSAVTCGADLVVQSLHKTLPSLTQTAIAHRNGTLISEKAYKEAVNLFQTSSPSYLLLASMEGCIGLLEQKGEELFSEWQAALEEFYRKTKGLKHLSVVQEAGVFARDRSKLIVSTAGTSLTGTELMERLRTGYRIEAEMAAEQYLIAMTGMGDTKESLMRFAEALLELDAECRPAPKRELCYPPLPVCRCGVAEALKAQAEECELKASVGRIAAEYVWAYPPGIPLLVPGEEISAELTVFLREKEE
ncbi:MAG: aminotransferase class I/II-fold pyridoxal phosphate-dependent enzyme, partial [Lachnospiraceae bacterium]